jgi:predicted short-subunit dehydrogenase-like oxidoreductase (DUF2520 family)
VSGSSSDCGSRQEVSGSSSDSGSHPNEGRVGVVGPGRVGTVLAAALEARGERIRAVVGRGEESLSRFRTRFPDAHAVGLGGLADCGLVLVATPDDVLERTLTELAVADVVGEGHRVVHVSGRHGLAALRPVRLTGAHVAACHPAQTIPDATAASQLLDGAPWAVTADPGDRAWAHGLIRRLGGEPVDVAEGARLLYHAGLSVGANAVGAAVAVARGLLLAAGLDEPGRFLGPLVQASVDNVLAGGASAITGPVRRGDAGTVRAHLDALDRDLPAHAEAYRDLSRVILRQVGPELGPTDRAALSGLLAGPTDGGEVAS